MRYVKIEYGRITELYPNRPNWKYEDGGAVTEEYLNRNGIYALNEPHQNDRKYQEKSMADWDVQPTVATVTYYEIIDVKPVANNPITHKVELNSNDMWVIDEIKSTITKTYSIIPRSPEEIDYFIKTNPVISEEDKFEKPVDNWEFDHVRGYVIKTYYTLVEDPDRKLFPEELYRVTRTDHSAWERDSSCIYEKCNYELLDFSTAKEKMLEFLGYTRWICEIGGCMWRGYKIHTDRESQAKISGLYSILTTTDITTFEWKTKDGFVVLAKNDAISMCLTVYSYVTKLFSKEREISIMIENATSFDELLNLHRNMLSMLTLSPELYTA